MPGFSGCHCMTVNVLGGPVCCCCGHQMTDVGKTVPLPCARAHCPYAYLSKSVLGAELPSSLHAGCTRMRRVPRGLWPATPTSARGRRQALLMSGSTGVSVRGRLPAFLGDSPLAAAIYLLRGQCGDRADQGLSACMCPVCTMQQHSTAVRWGTIPVLL